MRTLDSVEKAANESRISFTILGNPETADFVLVDTGAAPLGVDELAAYRKRGMYFCGVVGLGFDGAPRTALEEPLDTSAVTALAEAFLAGLSARLLDGDPALRELFALFALEDTRSC